MLSSYIIGERVLIKKNRLVILFTTIIKYIKTLLASSAVIKAILFQVVWLKKIKY